MLAHHLAANASTCTARRAFCTCNKCMNAGRSRLTARASALAEPPVAPVWRSTSMSKRSDNFDSDGRAESQTMGSLHCLWPRYGQKCSLATSSTAHSTAKGSTGKQLPLMVAQLAGWFTDGPLHCEDTLPQLQQQQQQQLQQSSPLAGLASFWRYQGLRL